jgi:putative endonuclease
MNQEETSTYWYVYLLRCNDNSIYTGCTSNIKERIQRHKKGQVTYTSSRLPIKLITCIAFTNKYKAYDFEKYLKSGSGKAFAGKRLVC